MIVKLLTEHNLEFLSLKGGCRGLSESTLIKMSNCWKSHAAAQMVYFISFTCLFTDNNNNNNTAVVLHRSKRGWGSVIGENQGLPLLRICCSQNFSQMEKLEPNEINLA